MPGFDVFDPNLPLMEDHFIEASAGTGKTFTIEHLVLRFLERDIPLDQILVVTFTKAATRELATRIRHGIIRSGLTPMEEPRIFTLHGFCFHTLQTFALETDFPLDHLEESDGSERITQIVKDTLRTVTIPPTQLDWLLRSYRGDFERLTAALTATVMRQLPIEGIRSFAEIAEEYAVYPEMAADLESLLPHFKQAEMPTRLEELPPELLKFHPDNQKKRSRAAYPPKLAALMPLIVEMNDTLQIFARIAEAARMRASEEEDLFSYDDLLRAMEYHTRDSAFSEKVRSLYKVVLIDEFQDTDPLQWKIFSRLFHSHCPLYVVGDPKQSIYRFRDADIYTYLAAKEQFSRHVRLERNYRAHPHLVDALNNLFTSIPNFFPLPKRGDALPCPPVLADETKTGEGTLQFWKGDKEDDFYPAIVSEIVRLDLPYRECAILVRDRHQAERIAHYCHEKRLPTVTQRSTRLSDSPAVGIFDDLLESVRHPRHPGKALGGPLFGWDHARISRESDAMIPLFLSWKDVLESEGLLSLFHRVMEKQLPTLLTHENGKQLYREMTQLAEHGEPWPDIPIVQASAEDAVQILTTHVSKGLEFGLVIPLGLISPSRVTRELVSTGSALVLSDNTEHLAELDAEKMRQFYVALTRAKSHLRIPVLPPKKRALGASSPMELFLANYPHDLTYTEVSSDVKPLEKKRPKLTPPPEIHRSDAPLFLQSFSSLAVKEEHAPVTVPEGDLPPGPETGRLLHTILENLPFNPDLLRGTLLEPFTERVEQMVTTTLTTPLPSPDGPFTLSEVDPSMWIPELEFLYPSPEGYLKGYIDLFFQHRGKAYFLDWKSNLLEDYSQASLEDAMTAYDYHLQEKIYREAIKKYLSLFTPKLPFGGAYYLFLRGLPEGVFVAKIS